jgi:hypothetical protein
MTGIDFNARDRLGRTPLFWAAWREGADETGRLLDQGSPLEGADAYGWTPLTAAVRAGQTESVRLLLERGAAIPAPDVYGEAVLTMALRRRFTEIARLLQYAGAKEPPIVDKARRTGTNAFPILRHEKESYHQDEIVRFWVGVSPLTDEPIPRHLWTTTLRITQPDGVLRSYSGGWPKDGCPERGWEGAEGLRANVPDKGVSTVVFEFAGLQTEPARLIVESD